GYTIEGALQHRVQLADGSWAHLEDLKSGDRVALACGIQVWPRAYVAIEHTPARRHASLSDVAVLANPSLSPVIRHRAGRFTLSATAIDRALVTTGYVPGRPGKVLATRQQLSISPVLDEALAHLLGYFVGDGNLTKSGICLTCGDE